MVVFELSYLAHISASARPCIMHQQNTKRRKGRQGGTYGIALRGYCRLARVSASLFWQTVAAKVNLAKAIPSTETGIWPDGKRFNIVLSGRKAIGPDGREFIFPSGRVFFGDASSL